MATATPCATALANAISALEELPGFTATVLEIGALLGISGAVDFATLGVALGEISVLEAGALALLLRRAYNQANAVSTSAAAFVNNALTCITNFVTGSGGTVPSGGGGPVATAVAPIPAITGQTAGVGSCSTKSGNKGICCAAVTQLGLARAAQGFQYTNCNGKVVCLACGTKVSTSKKNPGATVFSVKRVTCGPSGCPALGALQGQIQLPV